MFSLQECVKTNSWNEWRILDKLHISLIQNSHYNSLYRNSPFHTLQKNLSQKIHPYMSLGQTHQGRTRTQRPQLWLPAYPYCGHVPPKPSPRSRGSDRLTKEGMILSLSGPEANWINANLIAAQQFSYTVDADLCHGQVNSTFCLLFYKQIVWPSICFVFYYECSVFLIQF